MATTPARRAPLTYRAYRFPHRRGRLLRRWRSQGRVAGFASLGIGVLLYRRTARNFNPVAATCGKVTIAEAEIIVAPGELDPDEVHTPGIYVQRLVHNPTPEKRIEKRCVREA